MHEIRVAVLGGGNGISAVLSGLARQARKGRPLSIAAIVATADDGGSSGRLRQERGGIPPGDLRNCLLALAPENAEPFQRLFAHRYDGQGDLAGHSLGNLILAAMAELEGSYLSAVELAASMLRAHGRVLPVSVDSVRLEAEAGDGLRISGESRIGRSPSAVRRVWLEPQDARPTAGVLEAIREADLIVLGPGSLFTSLLAVALVPGVREAIHASAGLRVLVANLMTQPGETLGMDLEDHMQALERHVGAGLVEIVLAHEAALDAERVKPYVAQSADPIAALFRSERGERLVLGNLITHAGKIRHDPELLVRALLDLLEEARPEGARSRRSTGSGPG